MSYTKSRPLRRHSYNPLGIAIAVIFLLGIIYVATILIGAGVLTYQGHFDNQSFIDVLKTADNWNVFSLFSGL